MPYDYASGGTLKLEGEPYRGGLMFVSNSNNTFNVVNYLEMEHYLYGVINAEMGRRSPAEALKAQAVASRSYAARHMGAHSGEGFDVCSSAHCQVYRGCSGEYAETTKAADETAGQMIYYGGKVASANFFKNSGGATQNSEDAWNEAEGHLRAVADEFSPEYAWSWTASPGELARLLSNSGLDAGEPLSVSVSRRSANSYVAELSIKGSKGAVVLKNEQIRSALGTANVKSLNFTLAPSETGAAAGAAGPALYASDGAAVSKLGASAYAISALAGAAPVSVRLAGAALLGAANRAANPAATAAGPADEGEASLAGGGVTFSGRGYGHGVGMPQDSAIEMAKLGYDYVSILKKYFTGVEVRKAA
jgi:stage II sporulation protein D